MGKAELFAWDPDRSRWKTVGVYPSRADARKARLKLFGGDRSQAVIQDAGMIPPILRPGEVPDWYIRLPAHPR